MVIATSDSTNTLISLPSSPKRVISAESLSLSSDASENDFVATALRTPEDPFCYEDDCFTDQTSSEVFIPSQNSRLDIDECLQYLPAVRERCDELLATGTTHFHESSQDRVLYVSQGEIAHAVPLQCDIIMSDKATSCHILILRSTSTKGLPLATCAHVDGTTYEKCVRSAIQHHANHHSLLDMDETIEMDIHIVGGFEDEGSRKISEWLLRLLAEIAHEEKELFRMTLATCAISSMNSNMNSPIGRGLAMEMRTGSVFLASCDAVIRGPSQALRSARLWAGQHDQLQVIHHERSNAITIQPFAYKAFTSLPALLSLPDHLLLKNTSTSPDCEEEDFCGSVRSTLSYLRDVPCHSIFGPHLDRTLAFRRSGRSNTWKRIC